MPMYTHVFSIPASQVSEEIIPHYQITPGLTIPILRCEECAALVSGDSYSQTLHNNFHDFLQWGR